MESVNISKVNELYESAAITMSGNQLLLHAVFSGVKTKRIYVYRSLDGVDWCSVNSMTLNGDVLDITVNDGGEGLQIKLAMDTDTKDSKLYYA